MKASILMYLILIGCSTGAMELRSRKILRNRTCLGCNKQDIQDPILIEKKSPKTNELTYEEEVRLFSERVFSEIHQKTPLSTVILGSTAICCSGMLLLLSEYSRNSH